MVLLWSWLACSGTSEEGAVTESESVDWTGGCGLDPYDLLPASEVGQVVAVEEAADLSLPASAIELTLGLAGLPAEFFDVQYDVKTWRVRYRTQDRGEPVDATMLLSYPVGAGDVPTFAWLHGTTGFTDACAPSALGLEGGAFNLLFASLGYVVVSPDYVGMNGIGEPAPFLHPYLVPEAAALPSLDAVRAAWAFEPEEDVGATPTRSLVWFGASEGGFTALWSDRYQPHYLPEANPVAVVASVPPADLPAIADQSLAAFEEATVGLLGGVIAWHDWYRVPHDLGDVVQPDIAAQATDALAESCSVSLVDDVSTVEEVFTAEFVASVLDGNEAFPEMACALARTRVVDSEVPHESDTPVMYVVAELDELVSAGPTRAAFQPLCDAGYRMNYLECARADHVDGAVWSLPEVLDWARDRVDGVPLEDVCVQRAAQACSLEGVDE